MKFSAWYIISSLYENQTLTTQTRYYWPCVIQEKRNRRSKFLHKIELKPKQTHQDVYCKLMCILSSYRVIDRCILSSYSVIDRCILSSYSVIDRCILSSYSVIDRCILSSYSVIDRCILSSYSVIDRCILSS